MKKYLLATLVVFISCTINAQEIVLKKGETLSETKKGSYYAFPELEKFSGTWVDSSGETDFKIIIKNKKTFLPGKGLDFYRDYLQGYYCHDQKYCKPKPEDFTISNGTTTTNENIAEFIFWDSDKAKNAKATLELLTSQGNKARWRLSNKEMVTINNGKKDAGFSVPTDIVLTKVE